MGWEAGLDHTSQQPFLMSLSGMHFKEINHWVSMRNNRSVRNQEASQQQTKLSISCCDLTWWCDFVLHSWLELMDSVIHISSWRFFKSIQSVKCLYLTALLNKSRSIDCYSCWVCRAKIPFSVCYPNILRMKIYFHFFNFIWKPYDARMRWKKHENEVRRFDEFIA